MIQQIMGSLTISIPILLLSLIYLIFTRVLGRPISAEKSPTTVWILDFLLWPVGIVAFFTVAKHAGAE